MSARGPVSSLQFTQKQVTRRNLVRGAAGAIGAGLLLPKHLYAGDTDDLHEHAEDAQPNPIPGGIAPFAPFGIFIHHNPLKPSTPLADINDPSQITDFDGFVGLTHIRGGGTEMNTLTGVSTPLAYQADMGFSQGKFIGSDGHAHEGTFAFV